jgi:hypothetical protein
MGTLWTVGDSFSSDFDIHSDDDSNVKKYLKLKNENTLISWPNTLSVMLNYKIKNLAKGGNSNYQIFQDFCDVSSQISENDVVIICWGLITKFRTVWNNNFKNNYPTKGGFWDNVIEDRENIKWSDEIYSWENLILNYAKCKKFKIYFWCGEEKNLVKNKQITTIQSLIRLGCKTMNDDTNGLINDSHFSVDGHKQLALIFYNLINNE